MGTWNASTNTPTLPDPTTVKGDYYIVTVAGTYLSVDYQIGDWIISDGVGWTKVDNSDSVTSVFGRTGNVLAIEADYQAYYPRLSQVYTNPTWIGSGACIRIATSAAGNAETDIGFVNNKVDTAAILAHVGSNTAFVKTIYGQFGSVNLSMIFGLFTYAPRIATGGSIITFSNGEPAIEFGQGLSGFNASGLYVTTGDLFSSASSMFYTHESTYSGEQALGGSGSATAPFHTLTENGQTGFAPSAFFNPDPTNLYVNETNPISVSGSSTPDAFHDVLINTGVNLACETDMDLSLGNGYTWGMRGENTNSYFRGKSSEMLIYNDVRSSGQVYDIMEILNKAVKAY